MAFVGLRCRGVNDCATAFPAENQIYSRTTNGLGRNQAVHMPNGRCIVAIGCVLENIIGSYGETGGQNLALVDTIPCGGQRGLPIGEGDDTREK